MINIYFNVKSDHFYNLYDIHSFTNEMRSSKVWDQCLINQLDG